MWPVVKVLTSAIVITVVSEVAKRHDRLGALIASLPLVTLLAIAWMTIEGQGRDKVATHALYTFWYVLPTLPMFLWIPWSLQRGWSLGLTMAGAVLLTFLCFGLTALVGRQFGVQLM